MRSEEARPDLGQSLLRGRELLPRAPNEDAIAHVLRAYCVPPTPNPAIVLVLCVVFALILS